MNVLIVDSDGAQREQLIEVMAWFGIVEAVLQADRLAAIGAIAQRTSIAVVLVGEVDDASQGEVLREIPRLLPEARRIAYNALDLATSTMLHDAGAEVVFDRRMSNWKAALVLRPLFWDAPPPVLPDVTTAAYSTY